MAQVIISNPACPSAGTFGEFTKCRSFQRLAAKEPDASRAQRVKASIGWQAFDHTSAAQHLNSSFGETRQQSVTTGRNRKADQGILCQVLRCSISNTLTYALLHPPPGLRQKAQVDSGGWSTRITRAARRCGERSQVVYAKRKPVQATRRLRQPAEGVGLDVAPHSRVVVAQTVVLPVGGIQAASQLRGQHR
jgi:hypothetical protein